jgi:hypothetical protein
LTGSYKGRLPEDDGWHGMGGDLFLRLTFRGEKIARVEIDYL